jgi:hypothetical protein
MTNTISMSLDNLPLPSVASGAVLAELHIGSYNPIRKDVRVTDAVHNAEGASSDSGQYVKRLFPGVKQFTQIKTLEMRGRIGHKKMTAPWSDGGQRFLVVAVMPDYVQFVTSIEQQYWGVVQEIQDDYPNILRMVQAKMGSTFEPHLYPTADQLPQQFKFRHVRVPVPTINDFDRIAGSAQAVMREEFEKHMAQVQKDIVIDMQENTRKVLEKMSERLSDDDNKFKNTLVTNVSDHAQHMENYNAVLQLPEVETMKRNVQNILEMANPEVLRHSSEVRRQVKEKVDAVLKSMDW